MNQPVWSTARATYSRHHLLRRRLIAGRRRPLAAHIHSASRKLAEDEPKPPPQGSWQPLFPHAIPLDGPVADQQKNGGLPDEGSPKTPKPVDVSHYGSALRRAGRNVKKVKELPQVGIPSWLLDRNVDLIEDRPSEPVVDGYLEGRKGLPKRSAEPPAASNSSNRVDDEPSNDVLSERYLLQQMRVHNSTVDEIASLVQAGLRIPGSENAYAIASIKNHINLSSPKKGCTGYLTAFVHELARQNEADFLRLTPQDIAEIGGDYMETISEFQMNTLSSLGYDTAKVAFSQLQTQQEEYAEQEDIDAADEESDGLDSPKFQDSLANSMSKLIGIPVKVGVVSNTKINDFFNPNKMMDTRSSGRSLSQDSANPFSGQAFTIKDDTPDMMLSLLLETMLNAPELKRIRQDPNTATNSSTKPRHDQSSNGVELQRGSNKLVVLIEDYQWMYLTTQGAKFLDKLHELVETRRKEGQAVLIVGVSSSEKFLSGRDSKGAIDEAQAQHWDRWTRNVVVPVRSNSDDGFLWNEHKRKIRDINLRHLRDMIRKTAPDQAMVSGVIDDWDIALDSKFAFLGGLDRSIWPMFRVNRIATIAQGLLSDSEPMTANAIGEALATIDASDASKYRWHKRDSERSKTSKESASSIADNDSLGSEQKKEDRLKKLRKKCNSYEKKLLNGVVDSKAIRTTFADVHVPQETIKAVKTLTSLSLVRPEAFTYGVLAHDRIPGILLYGPPGTGKTLLAKAVAKESGATVLEVSGSDVYDMYVGEGEKNVKAIFTLARKLSPCVVFIDEADAILGSRSSGHSRASHRELVNQFLREWDGVTDTNAFIMIATNRPYDLDEASLRRVPRRLLVDLPTEKDREAILRIHLKDEVLDPGVDVAKLAEQTPFYSGSDLKNLCVAAALGCVREEYEASLSGSPTTSEAENVVKASANDTAADALSSSSTTDNSTPPTEPIPPNPSSQVEPNTSSKTDTPSHPAKRVLLPRHFESALLEISASVSEDMGSLSAIRKFDEKYGDRRGRRKGLKGGYGFGVEVEGQEGGKGAGGGRVRREV